MPTRLTTSPPPSERGNAAQQSCLWILIMRPTEWVAIINQVAPAVVVGLSDESTSGSPTISPSTLLVIQEKGFGGSVPIADVGHSASATGGTTGVPRILIQNQAWCFDLSDLPSDWDALWVSARAK